MAEMRILTDEGLSRFSEYLGALRTGGGMIPVPEGLLQDDRLARKISDTVVVEQIQFVTKLEAAAYLNRKVSNLETGDVFFNVGLWSWLSVFYFDLVCPKRTDGTRVPGEDYRYILRAGSNWQHYYRHLLASPARIHAVHQEKARLLLSGPLHIMGDFIEQLASRQEVAANVGAIAAADILYWDATRKSPKKGSASNRRKPGTLRRFIDIIQQLDLTYDLCSMNGQEIGGLLPEEFSKWRT